jgi:hypothetical protein
MSLTATTHDKDYIICDYSEGLDVTQLASLKAQGLFSSSIQDVELLRELLVEAAHYNGTHGFYQFDQLAQSLDWKARGLPANMTTVEALKSYVDDRANRRMERFSPLNGWDPLVGDKQSDMRFAESLALILPWIVDRSSRETSWWKYHQSGRSEGRFKEPFRFDMFYAAAWLGMYSETLAYYPPINMYGEGMPLTIADIVGDNFTAREAPYYKPAVPENNPNREALFSVPYPDDAQPGRAVISAIAPVYYTGNFSGFYYDDTFMGVLGVDIEVNSVSHFLDALQGTVAPTSFSMLVDAKFNTIVISRNTTSRIYPERTGMEPERVSYDINGNVIADRRNSTYLPSDTMIQDLTKLQSANWTLLLETIRNEPRGAHGYTTLNITFTGDTDPREFYVWFDGWDYVAHWYLLIFAPKEEVDTAVQVLAGPSHITMPITQGDDTSQVITLRTVKGDSITGQGIIANHGRVDMYLSPKKMPEGVTLLGTAGTSANGSDSANVQWPYLLRAGQILPIDFQVETQLLPIGNKMDYMVFQLRDADYPDCRHNSDVALALSIQVNAQNCTDSSRVLSDFGVCVCPTGAIEMAHSCVDITVLTCSVVIPLFLIIILGVYLHGLAKRKKADAVWEVKPSDLKIGETPFILGEGSFGLVVLADYRGTQVAVKRVLPLKKTGKGGKDSSKKDPFGSKAVLSEFCNQGSAVTGRSSASNVPIVPSTSSEPFVTPGEAVAMAEDASEAYQDEVDAEKGLAKKRGRNSFTSSVFEKLPTLRSEDRIKRHPYKSGRSSCKWEDKRRKEFIKEMRLVAKLRHPCIITGEVFCPTMTISLALLTTFHHFRSL